MGGRVSLVIGAVLATLLLAGPAFAATCEVDQVSPQEYTKFLQAVYSPNGLLTLEKFGSAEKPITDTISRDSTAIVDYASGVVQPIDINSNLAVDTKRSKTFPDNMIIRGPFLVIAVLDDTLRIAKDSDDYAYDKGLQERFEGRLEYTASMEALHALRDVDMLRKVFLGSVGAGDRIRNVIRTSEFSVTATCAANGCSQEMYSAFMKYMNVGASAQMVVEFGGGFVWRHILPSWVKSPIYNRAVQLKNRVAKYSTDLKKAVLDTASNVSDNAKAVVKGGDGLDPITSGGFSPKRAASLAAKDKAGMEVWASFVEERGRVIVDKAADLRTCIQNPEKCGLKGEQLSEIVASLTDVSDALDKMGMDNVVVVTNGQQKIVSTKKLVEYFKNLEKKEDVTDFDKETLLALVDAYTNTVENAGHLARSIADDAPIAATWSGMVNQKLRESTGGGIKGAAAEYVATPLAVYLRRIAVAPRENIYAVTGAYHAPKMSWGPLLGYGYDLPKSWKVTLIYPPSDASYRDSFVDIIINGGSDPGDIFKSVLSLSGAGIIHRALSDLLGREIPTVGIIMTEEQSQMYSTGPAILAMGVPAQECPSCTFKMRNGVATVTNLGSDPLVGSVVEDTNALSEGSTAILFGHHVNFRFSDGSEIDIPRAASEGRSCYEKCPLVANSAVRTLFGDDPARAMFIASYLQSIGAVAGLPGIAVTGALSMITMSECGDCVDDKGGYYLHMRVPPQRESKQIFEVTSNDALSSVLDSVGSALGSISETLSAEINAFKMRAEAEAIRNSGAYVQFEAKEIDHGELHISKLVELWSKPSEMIPTTLSENGSISGSGGGHDAIFDKRAGEVRVDGTPIITNPTLTRLVYIDNTVPGIVVPAWLIVSEFTADPAFTATKDGYVVNDQEFLRCFASRIPDGKPTTEFFESIMGRILTVTTTDGTVDFGKDVVATKYDWSGRVTRLEVGSNYGVTLEASKFEVDGEGNTINVDLKTEDVDFGTLVSIIFENGALYVKDGKVLVSIRRLAHFPGGYVQDVSLSPTEDKNAMNAHFTPTPDAPDDVREQIDRINEILERMGGINSILAENGAVALYRDENGVLWLRIYDRNAMQALTVDQAYEILRSVLAGDGKYSRFEVLDGSLQIYRNGGSAYLSYIDKSTGQRSTVLVNSYEVDANGFVLHTEEGDHIVSVAEQDGTVVALLDGVIYGPVVVPGAVRQEKVLGVYQDPNTGALVVKTDQGTHTIQVKVDSNGTPQLLLDGVLQGIIQAMQGPKGFVSYNPDTGEWSFVTGLLTPLAEAFKNGIKISLDGGGNLAASPAAWSFRPNPYMSTHGGGLSLPVFEGPEIVLLLVAVAAIFAIIR